MSELTTPLLLRRTADVIQRGHCKGYLAIDDTGQKLHPSHPQARYWCALGAIIRTSNEFAFSRCDETAARVALATSPECLEIDPGQTTSIEHRIGLFNDRPETTQHDVIAWLRRTADRLEESP